MAETAAHLTDKNDTCNRRPYDRCKETSHSKNDKSLGQRLKSNQLESLATDAADYCTKHQQWEKDPAGHTGTKAESLRR